METRIPILIMPHGSIVALDPRLSLCWSSDLVLSAQKMPKLPEYGCVPVLVTPADGAVR
jgi:hypothetical protein